MPQSLARVVIHTVFSTKNRTPFLSESAFRRRLQAYMAGVLQDLRCPPIAINGVADHVHILCNLSRTVSIAQLVEEVKTGPSKWVKTQDRALFDFQWQSGYGTFSVSESNVAQVKAYVEDQETRHESMDFKQEFRALCRKHGVEVDERYVWD